MKFNSFLLQLLWDQRDQSAELFAQQLLKFSEGRLPIDEEHFLTLNTIYNSTDSVGDLMCEAFLNLLYIYNTYYIGDRAILASKTVPLHTIYSMILNKLQEAFIYNSMDSVVGDQVSIDFPIEFFNSLQPPGTVPYWSS